MTYYEEKLNELRELLRLVGIGKKDLTNERSTIKNQYDGYLLLKDEVVKLAKERQKGFPYLAEAYDELFKLRDKNDIDWLIHKKRPAEKASDLVKQYSLDKRQALKEMKIYEYLVKYYEDICPFLVDLREEEIGSLEMIDQDLLKEYSEEELQDEATKYLTKEEYRKLPSIERNQMALDRFWKRPKSKWIIGRLYERYIGYLYEEQGYDVEYVGIFKGYEDLGRDLICQKKKEFIIIQCKNWSQFRTIYEKHIFQFFGTVFQYKDANPAKKVKAIFYTSTELSDLARRFAKELNIDIVENYKFDKNYPCIKCNISKVDGTKIYHLPFDQQYDNTKIERNKGEFYCPTVKEAEEAGFRRAFRHHLNKGK